MDAGPRAAGPPGVAGDALLYQRLGYFPQLGQVPPAVTEHVHARAMELVGERIDSHGRPSERMLRRCRELVRQRTGAVWDPDRVRSVAETAMRQALQGKDNPADVINVALEALTGQGCELPAYSMLDRLAGRLRTRGADQVSLKGAMGWSAAC